MSCRSIEINYFYFVRFVNGAHGSQFSIALYHLITIKLTMLEIRGNNKNNIYVVYRYILPNLV